MTNRATFGVVGGYGATGRVVVSELHKSCDGEIFIGGRDLTRGKALAAEFDGGVLTAQVDVFDAVSLDEFCSRCSIIINCGGPVMLTQDRVAQAALRRRCHYVDVAGISFVKERMSRNAREIANLGLSFVISAGWMPGLTELLPSYAYACAKAGMDTIESVKVYFGDRGEWSVNALRDVVWYIRQVGLQNPGHFSKGERVRAKMSEAFPRVDLSSSIGVGRFSMFGTPELNELGRQLADCDVFSYSYLSSLRNVISGTLIALLPLPEAWSIRMLRNAFRRNRIRVGGFVVVDVVGQAQGKRLTLTVRMVFEHGRDYWINGFVPATVARWIAEGKGIQTGVEFLAGAVDPVAFTAEVRKAGIEVTETWEP